MSLLLEQKRVVPWCSMYVHLQTFLLRGRAQAPLLSHHVLQFFPVRFTILLLFFYRFEWKHVHTLVQSDDYDEKWEALCKIFLWKSRCIHLCMLSHNLLISHYLLAGFKN